MLQIFAPLLACLFYGGWAAYANAEHGNHAALMAFAVQGGFAFVSTWLLTHIVIRVVKRQPVKLNRVAIFARCSLLLVVIPLAMHLAAGTPDIFQAMFPGLIIGNGYVWLLIGRLVAGIQDPLLQIPGEYSNS